jgi:histidine triad (HIT) family protein
MTISTLQANFPRRAIHAPMSDCIFCKIVEKKIPAHIVHDDELSLGFVDLNPQAPTHVLFIPKTHLSTANDIDSEQRMVAGHLVHAAARYAKSTGLAEAGYRLVVNCNQDGGQTVFHLHLHLLAGRRMAWPPG